ncbi:MAG TPA: peptide ABC transporter substrate-binding protein [Ktedonobacteraceae bacterium]|nr:peptide ABC transporter substrate-binding protein [Ktedonobacteraceae bacterium]
MRTRPASLWLCLLLLVALAACDSAPAQPTQQHVNSPLLGPYAATLPASQKRSGTIVVADRQFPDAVNPLFSGSPVDFELQSALWAAPVVFDDHFHAQPDQLTEVPLPENGDVRDNGKTIIMRLRHDLRWSDGQPILARDFQYWWQLDQNPDTGALNVSGYDQIASIETPDNFTVILHMKQPYGPYLSFLPYAAPYHAWNHLRPIDLQNTSPVMLAPLVTDGPYKLAGFTNGQSYTLMPNTNYRSTTFRGPFLVRLLFRAYSDITTLRAAILAGQVDVSEDYMEYELPGLGRLSGPTRLLETPAAAYEHLDFNLTNANFQDRNVRRAISLAIDTCAITREVLHMPDCSRATNQVEPPPSLYNDTTIAPRAYDEATARKLLAQAGWLPNAQGILIKQGKPFVVRLVTTADNPIRAATAALIQRDLQALGIQAQVQYYPLSSFFAVYSRGGILATGAFDLALFGYQNSPEPDDEYGVFHSSQIPTAAQPGLGNYGHINDPIIDQALTLGRDSVPFAQRVQDYHRFLAQLASQVYLIPLYTEINIMTVSNRTQNVLPNPDVLKNNWNIADWWVNI